jgi:hypothetical protein
MPGEVRYAGLGMSRWLSSYAHYPTEVRTRAAALKQPRTGLVELDGVDIYSLDLGAIGAYASCYHHVDVAETDHYTLRSRYSAGSLVCLTGASYTMSAERRR